MSSRIFWAIVVGFLLGVAGRSFLPLGWASIYFLALLAAAPVLLFYTGRLKIETLVIPVALLAMAAGIVRMDVAALSGDPVLTKYLGREITIEGVVFAEPDVRDNSVRVLIATSNIISPVRVPVHAGVLAVLPAHADIAYGDQVRAFGTLREPEAFDTGSTPVPSSSGGVTGQTGSPQAGSGRQFAYPQYLAAQGITYQLALAQAEKKQDAAWAGNPLLAGAIWVKQIFLGGIAAALPEPEAGLAGGITAGDKRSIGKELTIEFQHVGLVHMVVLSGYNITVVLNAVAWLMQLAPRVLQWSASGAVVVFFILMSGGASSATRAGLMALVVILAKATGRMFLASRALALVALLLVAWNPFVLAFDPSFQLSALATLGLIVFSPLFSERMQWIPKKFALREIASSTLGTQMAVLPLLLYQNGNLAIYSLPANLLALVAVPFAMFFSFVAGIAGVLLGSFAIPLAFPAYVLLAYVIEIAKFFAALPFAAISIGAFSAWWMLGGYAVLFVGAWYLHLKKSGRA